MTDTLAGLKLDGPMATHRLRTCLALILATVSAAGCNRSAPPRNLLLITVDTLRADHLGAYGAKLATPTIDRLAARGALFTHAMTAVPLTTPAHASLMTGLYPAHHGIRVHGVNGLAPGVATLAQDLSQAGRVSGAVVAAYPLARLFGLDRGFASLAP